MERASKIKNYQKVKPNEKNLDNLTSPEDTLLYTHMNEEKKKSKLFRYARNIIVTMGGTSLVAVVLYFLKGNLGILLAVFISLASVTLLFGPRGTILTIWWCSVCVLHRLSRLCFRPQFTYVDNLTKTSRRVTTLPPRPEVPHRRIICISDTHTLHSKLTIPEGDILVHCGDILILNEEIKNKNLCVETSPLALLKSFNTWLGELPVKAKVVIAGNHDRICQASGAEKISQILSNAIYLENSSAVVDGVRFFGIPMSPHGNISYNAWQYTDNDLRTIIESFSEKYSDFPTVDILVIHSKPFGIIESFVAEKNPKYILSGHYHHRYGATFNENSVFINCATLNSLYTPFHPPVVFDYIL